MPILTPGKNFKLKKSYKMQLANIVDPVRRGELKRALIQAQLASEVMPPKEKRGDRNQRGAPQTAE